MAKFFVTIYRKQQDIRDETTKTVLFSSLRRTTLKADFHKMLFYPIQKSLDT